MADFERLNLNPVSQAMATAIANEVTMGGSIYGYVMSQCQRFSLHHAPRVIESASTVIGDKTSHAEAFRRAGMIGLRVLNMTATPDRVDEIVSQATQSLEIAAANQKPAIAEGVTKFQLMRLGEQGYDSVQKYFGPLFGKWDGDLDSDPARHPYLHAGFGFPIALLNHLISTTEAADSAAITQLMDDLDGREEFERLARNPTDINWDWPSIFGSEA